VTLNLTVLPNSATTLDEEICEGDSYEFDGQSLTVGGTYTATFGAANGCDSIVTLNLTVLPNASTTLDEEICEGESYEFDGQSLTVGGTYTATFDAANGCDSIVTLNLTVLPNASTTLDEEICEGESYEFDGQSLTVGGTYTATFDAANGCDSIVTLNLTVLPNSATTLDEEICEGDSYEFDGQSLTVGGTYTATFDAANGCDSIVTLNLTVLPNSATTLDEEICEGESYEFDGQSLTVGGTYTATFDAANGCDSIVTLNLTVLPNASTTLDEEICEGESYEFDGQSLTVGGTYTATFDAANGCDSIVTLNLTVLPNSATTLDEEICEGDSYEFDGQSLTVGGTYTATFDAANGCDSIVTLNLTVLPNSATTLDEEICEGDSYEFDGQSLTVGGTYTATFDAANGCDSIVTLNLTVLPNSATTLDEEICEGDSYEFDGQSLTVGGTYTATFDAANGCDSIVTLNLTVVGDEPPVIVCPPAQEVFTSSTGLNVCVGMVPDLRGLVEATDDCTPAGDLIITQSPMPGATLGGSPGNQTIVTFTVTDAAGNSAVCQTALTLVDDQAPIILSCPPAQNVSASTSPDGACGALIPDLAAQVSATDNCTGSNGLIITQSPAAGTSFSGLHGAQQTIVFTVTDASGNSAVCSTVLTLVDDVAPQLDCPDPLAVELVDCAPGTPVSWSITATDNCDPLVIPAQLSGPSPGAYLSQGAYTVVYQATDAAGNSSTCSFAITVEQGPNSAPIIDLSGNGQFSMPACEEEAFVIFSGNIIDCGLSATDAPDAVAALITINGVPLTITYVDTEDGFAYFEATGFLPVGSYLLFATYNGVTVDALFTVVQDADQPAEIILPGNLTFTLPACASEMPATIAISITDDCDGLIDPGNAAFTLGGVPIFPTAVDNGYFLFELTISASNDGDVLSATYTDGAGQVSNATAAITVTSQPDTWPPLIVYPSQDINVQLDGCGGTEEVCFEITATDDCDGDVIPSVAINGAALLPVDGNRYCIEADAAGTFQVVITAQDNSGNSRQEDFFIVVTQAPAPAPTNLACNVDVNVTLDENCQRLITPDMVLEGSFGCLSEEDFVLTIVNDEDPSNGNILDGAGQWIYEVTLAPGVDPVPGFLPCWGYITGEDKTAPILECPDNTGQACVDVTLQSMSGALANTDPSLDMSNYSCYQQVFALGAGQRRYDLNYFQVDREDYYTFYFNIPGGWVPAMAMYQGGFTAGNPCENIIGFSHVGLQIALPIVTLPGGTGGAQLAMTLPLRPFEDYYLFVSSVLAGVTGDYTVYVSSQEGGRIGTWATTTTVDPLTWIETTTTAFTPYAGEAIGEVCFDLVCDDLDFLLNNPASLARTGRPTATDNCDTPTVTFTDQVSAGGDCSPTTLTRRFTATDSKGNSSVCTQIITVRKLTLGDVILPPFTVPIECDEDFISLPANQFGDSNPSPESTGYPFVVTSQGVILLDDSYCNIGATYQDSPRIDICESAYKVVRTWNVIDWCNPNLTPNAFPNLLNYQQVIKVGDFTPPVVACPAQASWSTGPFSCTAAFAVPLPEVTDNCSGWTVHTEIVTEVEVELFDQYGLPAGTRIDTVVVRTIPANAPTRNVGGIPAGSHYFRYTVTDDCGNTTVRYCPFEVLDLIAPTAVCEDQLNVSIGGGGFARILAEDIDGGSWDNCAIDRIEVRRNLFDQIGNTCGTGFSAWGPHVDFFCCDIGQEVTIELRVTDAAGNQNTCWMTVVPEDKLRPYCFAPPAASIGCDELPYDFDGTDLSQLQALFGMATAEDNCEAVAEELPPIVDLHCNFGRITRRFRAMDIHGNVSTNFCQQIITVEEVHDYEIKFPKDAEANCGTADAGAVEYTELACDLLAVSYTDEFFSASGEECYKIFRTWRVINWCQYDGESAPFIVGRDEDCDNNPGDEDVWVLHRPDGKTYIDRDGDEANNVPLSFQNPCWGITGFWRKADYDGGFFQYTQHIKVYDDQRPEIIAIGPDEFCSYDNLDCDGLVEYAFQLDENCTPDDLAVKVFLDAGDDGILDGEITAAALSGAYPDYVISGTFPIGCHAFEVRVEDGCGNTNALRLPFCVADCKAPGIQCINGLAIELMPVDTDGDGLPDGCGMETWAADFVVSPADDCTGPVKYSINRLGETPDPDASGLVLTSADLGTLVVEIWAWDGAGNGDFCETYILVQDNMGVCATQNALAVSGLIATEEDQPVEDVEVSISGQVYQSMLTGADGMYSFGGLLPSYDYTVTPARDGDYVNGVSTFDLVLINKHILGVERLDSPYKIIAADANNSRSVTTLDMIILRKLILGIDLELANNTSWRFVRASYVFPDPQNPWFEDFPEVLNLNNLGASIANGDFVAVKIGDVNLSAATSSLMEVEERSIVGAYFLELADQAIKAGGEYAAAFAASSADLDGYQGTLAFDAGRLELVDIVKGAASEDNFNLARSSEGLIATSWNGKVEAGQTLFTLTFRAKADGQLSELLGVSDRMVKAEAYDRAGQHQGLALRFSSGAVAQAGFELYQNVPNPFKEETVIGFRLPEAGPATLSISDAAGRPLRLLRLDGAEGYNEFRFKRGSLPTGVLQYSLKAGRHEATKMMLTVE
jgi:hypothetical protein